jgi:outer membrane protein
VADRSTIVPETPSSWTDRRFRFSSVRRFDPPLFEDLKINMSTFNRSIPFVALCLCGLLGAGQASAEVKMGVVNFQKLLEEAPQTKTAMASLENEFAPRRRELLTMQNDLKARDEKLQKEGAVMSEADRAKAEKTLRDQQREFSRKAGEFQDDASTRRNEEIGKVQRYLVTEIQAYGNANGYDLVLGDGVFFAKGPLDITANVLAVLATKPATLPAQPPAPAGAAKPAPK